MCTGIADEKGVNIRETENKMSESSYWQETKIYKKREEGKHCFWILKPFHGSKSFLCIVQFYGLLSYVILAH